MVQFINVNANIYLYYYPSAIANQLGTDLTKIKNKTIYQD